MRLSTKSLVRGAAIAALYAALTLLLQAISFGQVQFRVAEAMTILPAVCVEAVPGLFIGCLLANLLYGGVVWFDVVFGSLATLLAALLTRRFRARPWLAALMPVVSNGLIVGPVVAIGYMGSHDPRVLLLTMATVAAGEAVVVYVLGLPLLHGVKKLPEGVL